MIGLQAALVVFIVVGSLLAARRRRPSNDSQVARATVELATVIAQLEEADARLASLLAQTNEVPPPSISPEHDADARIADLASRMARVIYTEVNRRAGAAPHHYVEAWYGDEGYEFAFHHDAGVDQVLGYEFEANEFANAVDLLDDRSRMSPFEAWNRSALAHGWLGVYTSHWEDRTADWESLIRSNRARYYAYRLSKQDRIRLDS